jgi:acetyltransferase-like isoleucine patch superfamily enzyme
MKKFFHYIKLFFSHSYIVKFFFYKYKFKDIRIFPSVDIIFKGGNLSYDGNNIIGERTRLILRSSSKVHLGKNTWLGQNVYVETADNGSIVVDDNSSIQDYSRLNGDVYIGKNVLLSPNVFISSGKHFFDQQPQLPIRLQDYLIRHDPSYKEIRSKKVIIEDDCWIGVNAVIMPGIKIGKGSIIGANAVVTRNVLPYTIVGGIPAKTLQNRLNFLPPEAIYANCVEHLPYFYSGFLIEDYNASSSNEFKMRIEDGFSLSLKLENKKVINIILEIEANIMNEEILLVHNGESIKMVPGTKDYQFPFIFSDSNIYKFTFTEPEGKQLHSSYLMSVKLYLMNAKLE